MLWTELSIKVKVITTKSSLGVLDGEGRVIYKGLSSDRLGLSDSVLTDTYSALQLCPCAQNSVHAVGRGRGGTDIGGSQQRAGPMVNVVVDDV